MKKVFIITTYTGTLLSHLIRRINKVPYAHVSIALEEDLSPMYSFGRLNPKTPLFAGFVEENINEGLYAIRTNTMCRVYSLEVNDLQYMNLRENIKVVSDNRDNYSYDAMALIYLAIGTPKKSENKYVCSNFVADMLSKSNISIFEKLSYEIKPDDFYDLKGLDLEYEGLLSEYRKTKNFVADFMY